MELLKQDIYNHPDFNSSYLFREIDSEGSNYVDVTNLKRFLMKYAFLPNDNLLLAVIRRVDLDSDAKLNYKEFLDCLKPIEDVRPLVRKPRA